MKLIISDAKTGKTYQMDIPKEREGSLLGLRIGENIDGGIVGLASYKFQITGGCDKDGFPMRGDIKGTRKIKVLLSSGPGFRGRERGERKRKTVRGDTIGSDIVQINTKIVEYGEKSLDELIPKEK